MHNVSCNMQCVFENKFHTFSPFVHQKFKGNQHNLQRQINEILGHRDKHGSNLYVARLNPS